ncbi:alpha/beta hydrolase [Paludibacter sp.]|uniref:alpha/beta hydrolase n=1 Tax=Paludibacter sp. TaxID=1898105 RepID=UPI001355C3C0|nr:alpha/beta hydrolase [Paludibacter sp.]MTK54470.1 alpha/beta hydrolase [Paludibacter sp.]
MYFKKNLLVLTGTMLIAATVFSQTKVIDIWNGKVPGAIPNHSYKQIVDSAYWIKIRFVTKPTIQVYPAPADKNTGTAVVVCPGGGYYGISFINEGVEVAKWLNQLGITAVVLHYRLPDDAIMQNKSIAPLQDGQEAMRIVRRNAKKWGIDPHKIGIMGFSAGGHLATTVSTHFDEKVYEPKDTTSARPDFSLLIYPVVSMDSATTHWGSRESLLGKNPTPEMQKHFSNALQVTATTPPAFMAHSMDDGTVPVQNSIEYALALTKNNIPCELHIYEHGGHGYGLGKRNSGTESTWTEACEQWLKVKGLLARRSL